MPTTRTVGTDIQSSTHPVARPNLTTLLNVPLSHIELDPDNERRDPTVGLDELVASLRTLGLQEPVRLYKLAPTSFLVASGHRRVAAARALGWATIPAVVSPPPVDFVQHTVNRVASNLCRQDIDPISLATSVRILLDDYSVPAADVADWLGRSQSSIAGYLRLLDLPAEVQDFVRGGALPVGHALQLLRIKESEIDWFGNEIATVEECRSRLARSAVDESLSVRALEVRVKNCLANNEAIKARLARQQAAHPSHAAPTTHPLSLGPVTASIAPLLPAADDLQPARIAKARQAVRTAMHFDENDGPTLDHLRLAALILADAIYFSCDPGWNGLQGLIRLAKALNICKQKWEA